MININMVLNLDICIVGTETGNVQVLKEFYVKTREKQNQCHEQQIHFDSGLDLCCPQDIIIKSGETAFIDLGIQCAAWLPTEYGKPVIPSGFYMYPRSSISKTPLRLANSVGIIDSGYRGNLIAAVDNIKNQDYAIRRGQRLFQICAPDLSRVKITLVKELSKTERGSGGFGSTGL